jgi:hypothetical protein
MSPLQSLNGVPVYRAEPPGVPRGVPRGALIVIHEV